MGVGSTRCLVYGYHLMVVSFDEEPPRVARTCTRCGGPVRADVEDDRPKIVDLVAYRERKEIRAPVSAG